MAKSLLNKRWRQRLVDLIVFLWPIMPTRAKVWAFMNDGDLIGDAEVTNNSKKE